MADPSLVAARRAAILLGLLAVAAFGWYHWVYVAPVAAVWFEGLIWAWAAGAAVGWAYQRCLLDKGRTGPAWGAAFGGLFALTLVPAEIVGLLWGPFPEVSRPGDVVPLLPLAFLHMPLGFLFAWLLGKRRRIEWSFVVAVLALHVIIGGSVANFGGRGVTFLLFAGFFVFECIAGVALWWLHGKLLERGRAAQPTAGSASHQGPVDPGQGA